MINLFYRNVELMENDGLNWDRPVKMVKVKAYDEPIAVDECVAKIVKYIDGLPDVRTAWCCCGHGHEEGSTVEFRSRSNTPLTILADIIDKFGGRINCALWQDREGWRGWVLNGDFCHCSEEVKRQAGDHFATSSCVPIKKKKEKRK